jgi:hypothetical protein
MSNNASNRSPGPDSHDNVTDIVTAGHFQVGAGAERIESPVVTGKVLSFFGRQEISSWTHANKRKRSFVTCQHGVTIRCGRTYR